MPGQQQQQQHQGTAQRTRQVGGEGPTGTGEGRQIQDRLERIQRNANKLAGVAAAVNGLISQDAEQAADFVNGNQQVDGE